MDNVIGGALKLKKPIGGISKCVSVSLCPQLPRPHVGRGRESDGKTASFPLVSPPFSALCCRVLEQRLGGAGAGGKAEGGGARPVLCSCLTWARPVLCSCLALVRTRRIVGPRLRSRLCNRRVCSIRKRAAPEVRVCTMSDWLQHARPLFTRRWLWQEKEKEQHKGGCIWERAW